jgi:hypothetical protein
MDNALRRFAAWRHLTQVGPLVPAKIEDAVRLACDDRGKWLGNAVFVSHVGDWTLLQDLSGALGAIPGAVWQKLAENDELVFAGYNDAICYGELVVVSGGSLQREFFDDRNSPDEKVDFGVLSDNPHEPFKTWVNVASFVDGDKLAFSEVGSLWVY